MPDDPFRPDSGEVLFLPLGGAGEIGMNLNLYGCDGRWLMVDLGIGFCNGAAPGVDVMVADPDFIVRRREALCGILLTHAHEDHLGAVPTLWPRLRCPVYCSPFAGAVVRRKLADAGLLDEVAPVTIQPGRPVEIGPFEVELISAAHSIPEGHIVAIRSDAGLVVHATDWKLDPDPVVGARTDEAALRALGEEGVDVLVCDSTNAFVDGSAGSEGALGPSLSEVVAGCAGRVAVTCFSSNIARIATIARAAVASGREPCLVGRSLWRMVEAARETGYFDDPPRLLTEHDAGYLPPEKVLLILTGSQGEPRAALTRIAAGDHPTVSLAEGDTVVFSSRVIPGNEIAIAEVQNRLVRRGIEVVTDGARAIHVSGHPGRAELAALYGWLAPKSLVPIHGEARHLYEHAALARASGIADATVVENGTLARLCPGPPAALDRVAAGRLAVDGSRLVPMDGDALRARRRIGSAGSAVATVVVDRRGALADDPLVTLQGLADGGADGLEGEAAAALAAAVEALPGRARREDDQVASAARRALRRSVHRATGKRPLTEIHVVRL